MPRPHALTWVTCFTYASVLTAAWFAALTHTSPTTPLRLSTLTLTLLTLAAMDIRSARLPSRAGWPAAVVGVGAHAGLFAVAAAADTAGDAKILFVLLPFEAFVALGRRAAIGVAAGIVAVVATAVALQAHSRSDAARLAEFVMFAIGVVFAVALGALAARAESGQRRAEGLVAELAESHARLREYADQAAALAAAAERARVARDLHDTAGHHLTVVAIQLEKAATYRDLDAVAADRALADARESARAALAEVRTAVGSLRAGTEGFALVTALRTLAQRLDHSGFGVRIEIDGCEEPGESAAFALYLAAQEGLTNAVRHSGAATATVRVEQRTTHSLLEISDSGGGFAPGAVEGHGLTGMRERLAVLGGELEVDTGRHGTRLRARLPQGAR